MRRVLLMLALSMLVPASLRAYSLMSFQYIAVTGNAGGQQAYALRLSRDNEVEYSLFVNQYFYTGRYPLSGLTYAYRFALVPARYVVSSFLQVGAGISTAGPLGVILWNLTAFHVVRLDIATHIYFPQLRPFIWNYPLWLGITVPV